MTDEKDIFETFGVEDTESETSERTSLGARMRQGLGTAFASRRNRVIAGVAVTAVILASGTGVVYAATQGGDGDYRTAVAEIADVSETLSLSGQLASSSSVGVSFQVEGTVGSVLVSLGDEVTAGQELATLDATSLEEAVTNAEDTLASAEQTLEDDLEAQSSGGTSDSSSSSETGTPSTGTSTPSTGTSTPSTGTSTPSTSTPSTGTDTPSGSTGDSGSGDSGSGSTEDPAVQEAIQAVSDAQQKLLEEYETATAAGEASSTALAEAEKVCAPFLSATLEDTDDGSSGGSEDSGESEGGESEGGESEGGDSEGEDSGSSESGTDTDALQSALETVQGQLTDCQSAVTATQEAQETASAANSALTEAASALDEKVTALQEALEATSSGTDTPETATPDTATDGDTTAPSTGSSTGSTADTSTSAPAASSTDSTDSASAPSGDSSGEMSSSTTITAERILADQAAIDSAEAELAIAEQNLSFASITSPIDGTIVSVALAEGDSVSAGSDSAVITVQGDGGYIVEATVSLTKIENVEVGQTAEVTLPAFGSTYTAEVSSIGVLNVSSTSTPSYTVTIAVDTGEESPRIGATANAEVELSDALDVLTVPTSAVTRSGATATVTRLNDGTPETVTVTLGAIGSERTEIVDGLSEGDVVVLADLTQEIATEEEETSTGLTGLGGSSEDSFEFPGGGEFPSGDFSPPGG